MHRYIVTYLQLIHQPPPFPSTKGAYHPQPGPPPHPGPPSFNGPYGELRYASLTMVFSGFNGKIRYNILGIRVI